MAGYTRQSTFADGDTITAALFNNEFNQLLNAFGNTSGHKHDGTANEGPVIGLIGDAGETSPNNKVLIDTTNNYIEFYVEVSSAPVQQIYIADGAIIPVTDNDIDLGTSSLEFKDIYIDGTATIDTLTVDEAATVGTTLGVTGATTLSSTLAVTGTSTLTGNVTTTNDLSVGGNLTVTGNATISGNLTFGDADTDSINLAAEIDSNIVPNTDNTYDLGTTTKEWRNLYIDGTANIDSLVADTADINGGTIDGATIATSDITVGAGKTLDVSSGTLTLADNQISGDKVEGGTIAATTVTTLTSTTGNITNVNATTVDSTNLEVTNLKAKDGTAAGSIADSTGVVTLASSVLTTTDINGGTIDGATIATSDITVGTGKTLDVSSGTLTLADNQISGDKVEGGTIAATTITDLTFGSLNDGTITITAFADEDDMSSDSATLVPTQQSVKAYVDSQVTAQDLDFQGDSGGALSIDLDSETLTIAGGTGIDTTGATNTLTVAIDSTVATLTGTQTLTNKTLTSPVLNTGVSGTAILDEDNMASDSATQLATQQSIKAYVDAEVGAIVTDVVSDTTPQLGGTLDTNGNLIQFGDSSGATDDRLQFGASQDLQIYHDGSDSYIKDEGTGNLYLTTNGSTMNLQAGSDNMVKIYKDAQVEIFHDASVKLATTSTGIDVTGTVVADGLTLGDNTTSEIPIYFNSSSTDFSVGANGNNFILAQTTGDLDTNQLLAVTSSGNVGIGTSSPNAYSNQTTLTINGATYGRLDIESSNTLRASLFATSGSASLVTTTDVLSFDTSGGEAMRIDSLGRLLLGTTTEGEASADNFTIEDTGSAGCGMTIRSGTAYEGKIFFSDGTSGADEYQGYMIYNHSNNSFALGTAGSERIRINSSGNVGIGLTNPSEKLEVSGKIKLGGMRLASNDSGRIGLNRNPDDGSATDSNLQRFQINGPYSGGDYLDFQSYNSSGTYTGGFVLNGGKFGIGTSSPNANLHIGSATATGDATNPALQIGGATTYRLGMYTSAEGAVIENKNGDDGLQFRVKTAGEAMRIDGGTGNVGIGTSSPTSAKLEVKGAKTQSGGAPIGNVLIADSTSLAANTGGGITFQGVYQTGGAITGFASIEAMKETSTDNEYGGALVLKTRQDQGSMNERMRIDSAGNLLVGATSFGYSGSQDAIQLGGTEGRIDIENDTTSTAYVISFYNPNGNVGKITTSGSSTNYDTSSDYRLKENVNYEFNALDRVTQLKPARFNFIADADTTVDGFLAHEVQDIVPEAITGEKDAVDDEGNPEYQGIDQSKLVPLLTKAIQEQQEQIEALQSEINKLKGE